jgi:hypothetical protein
MNDAPRAGGDHRIGGGGIVDMELRMVRRQTCS